MDAGSDPVQIAGRKISVALGRTSRLVSALRPFYETALTHLHGGRGIPWMINGVPFRIDPRQRHLMGQEWDTEVAAFLSKRVQPGDLCLDVGANAGVYVLQFCHWTAPASRVIAFEPNENARRVLQIHIRMNGFEEQVEIIPDAITDSEGEATFYFAGVSGMSRLGEANDLLKETAQHTTVTTTTLDRFCERRKLRPDWLLLDIEGYELHALSGARQLLTSCPTLQIVVEMHPALWPSAQTTIAQWDEFFQETGFRPIPLMGQHNPLYDTGSVYLERT
jgi:FkbM family methyltransferase